MKRIYVFLHMFLSQTVRIIVSRKIIIRIKKKMYNLNTDLIKHETII